MEVGREREEWKRKSRNMAEEWEAVLYESALTDHENIGDTQRKAVTSFCYLGSALSNNELIDEEVTNGIHRACVSFGRLSVWQSVDTAWYQSENKSQGVQGGSTIELTIRNTDVRPGPVTVGTYNNWKTFTCVVYVLYCGSSGRTRWPTMKSFN